MGIIYRVCEGLLARLPVDERGQRVFAETLADWRREPRTLRGLVAVVRAVAGVAIKEAASASMSRTWTRVMVWSLAWVVLGLVLSRAFYGWNGLPAYKVAAWSISGFVFFFPTAILLSSLNRKGRVPIIGLCLTSALVGLLLIGWVSPAANRVVFGPLVDMPLLAKPAVTNAQAVFQTVWPPLPLDYLSGLYAHDLPGLVADGPPNGWSGVYFIAFNAAFVALCGLMPLMGSTLNRHQIWRRRLGIAFVVMLVLYRGRVADLVAPDWVIWNFVAPWLAVAMIAGASLWASGPREPRNLGTQGLR